MMSEFKAIVFDGKKTARKALEKLEDRGTVSGWIADPANERGDGLRPLRGAWCLRNSEPKIKEAGEWEAKQLTLDLARRDGDGGSSR